MHANVHPLSNSLALMQEAFRVTVDKGFLQDFLSSSTLIVDSSTLCDLYEKNISEMFHQIISLKYEPNC